MGSKWESVFLLGAVLVVMVTIIWGVIWISTWGPLVFVAIVVMILTNPISVSIVMVVIGVVLMGISYYMYFIKNK
jgi:hypothetical protein